MNRSEIKVAALALALIGLAALYLGNRKNVLGKPGVLIETRTLTNEFGVKVRDQAIAVPANIPGYKDELLPVSAREDEVLPKDTTFGRRRYEADKTYFQLSTVLMGTDRTSIHKPYYCITGQGWIIDKTEFTSIPMARPHAYELKAQLLTTHLTTNETQRAAVTGLFMYWYVSEDQLTPDHNEQMWWLARDLLTQGVLKRWAYVSMFSYCAPGGEQVLLQKMKRLAADVVPAFQVPPGKAEKESALLTDKNSVEGKETF